MDEVKWFKVLSKDLKAKDGGNFDYKVFQEITGITKKMIENKEVKKV